MATSQETQTERSYRQNNQNDLNKEVIPGVDGKTWRYTTCNYCKKNGHIARLCPKLAAKRARDTQNKENGQTGIHESQHQQQ